MSLASVVAELRAVVTDLGDLRQPEAAVALARLSDAGVPGADPSCWWGLAGLSDERPMSDDGDTITISPSKIESFLRCEPPSAAGGSRRAGRQRQVSASLGTLVHAVAAAAPAADAASSPG